MGAGKLAENTLNANKFFGQICLSSPQVYVLQKKISLGVRSPCSYLCAKCKKFFAVKFEN